MNNVYWVLLSVSLAVEQKLSSLFFFETEHLPGERELGESICNSSLQ